MLKRAATSLWNKSRRLFPCNSRLGACLNRGGVGETGLSCQALSDWREGPPLAAPFQQSRPQLSAPSSQPSFWGVTEPHRLHSVLGAFIWSPVSWRLTPEKEAWRGERCGPWSVHSLSKHASNLILHLAPCWPAGVGDPQLLLKNALNQTGVPAAHQPPPFLHQDKVSFLSGPRPHTSPLGWLFSLKVAPAFSPNLISPVLKCSQCVGLSP